MELVVGETALIDEGFSEYEALRAFFELADERGHSAPSVVVDERGTPVTHLDYADRMGASHARAGAWAFCRRPRAEALGLPSGTDWVRDHGMYLMFTGGSPYLPRPHFHDQLYIQRFGEAWPVPMAPVCSAGPVAWNNEGSRVCLLEERLGHVADNTGMAGFVLWEYEVHSGRSRAVASFPASMGLGFNEVTYSPDDTWIHLCQWAQGRNLLIRVADGLAVTLPVTSGAMGWNSRNGPSAMIAMIPDAATGRLVIYDYDVSADIAEHRSDLTSPTGLPLSVRELSMSADGYLALVTAPVGMRGLDQATRGGVHVAAIIDIDEGSIEPVLPVRFRTRSAQRRHTSPRWCEERRRAGQAPVAVADHLLEAAVPAVCEADSGAIQQDLLGRWIEVLDGITTAWTNGRIPPDRFADEYLQYALSCYRLNGLAADKAVSVMRLKARNNQFTRTVIRAIDATREYESRPHGSLPRPDQPLANGAAVTPTGSRVRALPGALNQVLDGLIAAGSISEARAAAQKLRQAVDGASGDAEVWPILALFSAEELAQGHYELVAKLGLCTVFWHAFFRPSLANSGLLKVTEPDLLPILLNGFEACTHLPERTVIGADAQTIFDAEDTRKQCQRVLSGLPVSEYLITAPQTWPVDSPGRQVAPDPEAHPPSEGGIAAAMRKRVFISYVREDSDLVDRLGTDLIAAGFDVWLDRTHLIGGVRWKSVIRKAIRDGDYFIACFSPHYVSKGETYMNEELNLAIERLRMINRARHWFIPIKLDACELPDYKIGPGETLDEDVEYIDFSNDWETALAKLVRSLSLEN